jgi:enediyne biosynthesis protein E4
VRSRLTTDSDAADQEEIVEPNVRGFFGPFRAVELSSRIVLWQKQKTGTLNGSVFTTEAQRTRRKFLCVLCASVAHLLAAFVFRIATARCLCEKSRRVFSSLSSVRRRLLFFAVILCVALVTSRAPAGEWHQEKGYRWAALEIGVAGKTGFTLLSPASTGIFFTNELDEAKGASNRVLYNGSGVAAGDFDSDGRPDLFFASLNGRCALYKNLGGWKFTNVTASSGLVFTNTNYRGAVFADVNGDRLLDLFVTTTGSGVLCFTNAGSGKFVDATAFAGTASRFGSVTLAFADVDGNGTVDLYVCNNRTDDIRDRGQVDLQSVRGQLVVPPGLRDRLVVVNGKVLEFGEPDSLYLNDGKGKFAPMPWISDYFSDEDGKPLPGIPADWGLTASFRDINGDGAPDLYVCNDYWSPDRIWIGDGMGKFRAIDRLAIRHTSASSMGVDFADLNRSGDVDMFVVDMLSRDHSLRKRQMLAQNPIESRVGMIEDRPQVMRNTLLQNRGDGTFAEIAEYAGLSASEWAWQPVFLDVDLDGFEDVLITSGHVKDVQDLDANAAIRGNQPPRGKPGDMVNFNGKMMTVHEAFIAQKMINARYYPRLETPIVTFRNRGEYRFEEKTRDWGLDTPGIHHGIATADFDGDGALDVVLNNLGAAAGVYRNTGSGARVAVKLKGFAPNTEGIGAKIKLLGGAVPVQSTEVIAGGRYMSGSDPLRVFAAGKATNMTIEVTWRSGKVSRVAGVSANRLCEIDESSAVVAPKAMKAAPVPLFKDVSGLVAHTHHEEAFDDYARQPLLPHKVSQLGPQIAWYDLDGDGFEDLVIGAGRGGSLSVFRNDGKGGFAKMPGAEAALPDDTAGIIGWTRAPGQCALLVGLASYEQGGHAAVKQVEATGGALKISDLLPATESSTGPLAMADIDGDGDLDLFVGGRVVPGRFPEAASSRVFRYDGTRFQQDAENSRVLKNVGLVSGAVWSDLDGDGFAELLLACEWGPIRIFKNKQGALREITRELGFEKFTGWWNSITTGDFDEDGTMDIVAGNWGLNTPWHASDEKPARIYFGDLGGAGVIDLVEAETDPLTSRIVPVRMLNTLAASMPFLRATFPSYKGYSEATVSDLLGDRQAVAREWRASTLASMIFLNRTNSFTPIELPMEAQLAPVFSINVADADGDGHQDIFVGQNFFGTRADVPRLDSGRGLWLRGDGRGKLDALPCLATGIASYGEHRGAALGDFNLDGRVDLALALNGGSVRVFQNVGGRPGLRVTIDGGPTNPAGVGAVIRVKSALGTGAAYEVHAGAGCGSQDSFSPVIAGSSTPVELVVRWPGGSVGTQRIDPGVTHVRVTHSPVLR